MKEPTQVVASLFLEKSTLSRYFGKVRNSTFETAKNRSGGSVLAAPSVEELIAYELTSKRTVKSIMDEYTDSQRRRWRLRLNPGDQSSSW